MGRSGDSGEVRFLRATLLVALVPIVGVLVCVPALLESSIITAGVAVVVAIDLLLAYEAERVLAFSG